MSKVFQGILKVNFIKFIIIKIINKVNHIGCRNENEMIRVWAHECMRVF